MNKKVINGYGETHLQGDLRITKALLPQTIKDIKFGIAVQEHGEISIFMNGAEVIKFQAKEVNKSDSTYTT